MSARSNLVCTDSTHDDDLHRVHENFMMTAIATKTIAADGATSTVTLELNLGQLSPTEEQSCTTPLAERDYTYAYRSSSSSTAVWAAPASDGPSGHWMFKEPSPLVEFLYTGSNFFRNWSNFAKSLLATERRAPAKASSKCFLPISFETSASIASSPAFSSSAAMASRIAALAARWHSSAKSAPLKPSVFWATNESGTLGAMGDFFSVDSRIPCLAGRSGKGM